jgi:cholesterol oxidase
MRRGAHATNYDAVVVGSGFGGSVSAFRLANAGFRVCLLERGKSYPPGSFPRSPRDMARNFWDPSKGLHGIFDIWTFRGLEAVVASGLGGGSLIYANVLLRKDKEWFFDNDPITGELKPWPVDYETLEQHYENVESVIQPQCYPFSAQPYAMTPKTIAMQMAATEMGRPDTWQLPPLAVTFANTGEPPAVGVPIHDGPNLHDRPRLTCFLCGECDIGCNFGSKNTLDYNYLTAFQQAGGEISTRSEVRSFEPLPDGGFTTRFVEHLEEKEGRPTATSRLRLQEVTSRILVLSAGTLGTPYLLLKNRSAFSAISRALGTRFCGNGDFLGFLRGGRFAAACRTEPRVLAPSYGPVITSAMRFGDSLDGTGAIGRGFYVEDGGYPQFASWLVEESNLPGTARRAAMFLYHRMLNRLTHSPVSMLGAEIATFLSDGRRSAATLPMLSMGRDTPDGVMRLRDGYLDIDWTVRTSRDYFRRVQLAMRGIAEALDARYADDPLWLLKRVVTVHALGGCPMGENADEGVVDSWGQVFGYPGLFVADGSVMPGPVGPNPSLTIAALSDRFADRMVERLGAP